MRIPESPLKEVPMSPRAISHLQDTVASTETYADEEPDPIRYRHLLMEVAKLDVRSQMVFLVRSLGRGSMRDIGNALGVSKLRVQQIFKAAILKLSILSR
jgi:DNA-directed RNA polymerase specialized sigma subunit